MTNIHDIKELSEYKWRLLADAVILLADNGFEIKFPSYLEKSGWDPLGALPKRRKEESLADRIRTSHHEVLIMTKKVSNSTQESINAAYSLLCNEGVRVISVYDEDLISDKVKLCV